MNPTLRNILAVVAGLVIGSAVNMALVTLSPVVIPPPPGTDLSTDKGLAAAIPLFEPKHFVMPFLAHALGAFVGALVTALIAVNRKMPFALVIGAFFLLGGIGAAVMLPAPLWFEALDLLAAYIPMAYLAGRIASRTKRTGGASQTFVENR